MDLLRRILRTDAILFSRAIASVAALAIAFGAPITDTDVSNAVEGVVTLIAFGNIALALLERRAVYSQRTHDEDVADAYAAGVAAANSPNLHTLPA